MNHRRPVRPSGPLPVHSLGIGTLSILVLLLVSLVGGAFGWRYYKDWQKAQTVRMELETKRKARAEAEARDAQCKDALKQLQDKLALWSEAHRLAASTPRIALAGPVSQLQAILRDTRSLELTTQVAIAKAAVVSVMENDVESFLHFMGDRSSSGTGFADLYQRRVQDGLERFNGERDKLCRSADGLPAP